MKIRLPNIRITLLLAGFAGFAALAVAADDNPALCEPFTGEYCIRQIPVLGDIIQDGVNTLYLAVTEGGLPSEPPPVEPPSVEPPAEGSPQLCDPLFGFCLSDLDDLGLPGSTLQAAVDSAYNTLTGGGSVEPPVPGLFMVGTGKANHDPKGRVCFGSGSMCSRSADPSTQPNAIRDHLISRATAITGANGDTFILVTTTNIGYFLAYKPEQSGLNGIYDVRLRIAEATGVPSTNVVVVSDHSHNGPDTIGIWGGVSADYMKITADAVVEAATRAYASRRQATIKVAGINQNENPVPGVPRLDSSYDLPPGNDLSKGNPYNEFRLLVADDAVSGARILTLVNYAPHATVTNGDQFDGKYRLTGDWAAWAPQEAEAVYGGTGVATIGTVGSTDWGKSGNIQQREAEARSRLRKLMATATAQLQPVLGAGVQVESTFIREPLMQPALALNYKPGVDHNKQGVSPVTDTTHGRDLRIDRSVLPPFMTGAVAGTYVSAIRIGDVFISTFPGEPFGELDHAIADEGRVQGAREHFLLGGANDFFGYMVKNQETYEQTARTGVFWVGGCPEEDFAKQIGLREEGEGACSDHWALMVSPTFGSHIVCTLQDQADRLGFVTANRDLECPVLTALDGLAPPPESDSPLANASHDGRNAAVQQAHDLAEQCRETAAPAALCDALQTGANTAEVYLGAERQAGATPDADLDGIPDASDNCPAVANTNQTDLDGDALGDACDTQDNRDSDGDGVQNHADTCANTPAGQAVNTSGCSASQRDSDGDGVNDAVDQCLNQAGPASNNGCPVAQDTTPNAFSFSSVSGVTPNTLVSSNVVTISGIDAPSPISVMTGEYRINGGAYTSAAGQISNGQTVQVRHTSAATNNTVTETALNIGGVTGKFRSTTAAGGTDTDPDAFGFVTQTGVAQNTPTVSNTITPVGYTATAVVKAGAGTEYSLNCTAPFTSAQGTITPGDSICVRHTSASSANTLKKTSLMIGTTVGYFSTRTAP